MVPRSYELTVLSIIPYHLPTALVVVAMYAIVYHTQKSKEQEKFSSE